jgi:hypothetical protein
MLIRPPSPRRCFHVLALGVAALSINGFSGFTAPASAQETAAPAPASLSYARMADLVASSPAVARVQVRSVKALAPARTPDLAPGRARFFVEAETLGLIRSEGVIAKRISFLVDGSATNARRPGLKKQLFLVFGRVSGNVSEFQLTSSTAFIPWSPANEALARKVIADVMAEDAPPAVTGINSAFHVPGAILGEGETQIFVETANESTISLSVIRRPDEQPHFSVSLGEIVDESATLPERDTMLWYRLACGLPSQLPALSLTELDRADAESANRDYNAFRDALGECDRSTSSVL